MEQPSTAMCSGRASSPARASASCECLGKSNSPRAVLSRASSPRRRKRWGFVKIVIILPSLQMTGACHNVLIGFWVLAKATWQISFAAMQTAAAACIVILCEPLLDKRQRCQYQWAIQSRTVLQGSCQGLHASLAGSNGSAACMEICVHRKRLCQCIVPKPEACLTCCCKTSSVLFVGFAAACRSCFAPGAACWGAAKF